MSKINREDFFSDDLLTAPLVLAKNMEEVLKVAAKIAGSMQVVSEQIKKATEVQQLVTATKEVNAAQSEFEKIQKQIEQAQMRTSKAYIDQADKLAAVKEAQRDAAKEAQLNRQIAQAQEGSIKKLGLELKKLKDQYSNLSAAERENAEVGGKLLNEIKLKDAEYKKLQTSIGNTNVNVGNYTQSIIDAIPALRGVIGGVQGFSMSLKAIPLFAIIGLIQTLVTYFTKTEDGALKLKVVVAALSAVFDTLVDWVIALGRELSNLSLDKIKQGFQDIGNAIKDFFLSRIELALKGFRGLGDAFTLLFKGEFRKAAKAAGQAVEDLVRGTVPLAWAVEGAVEAGKALAPVLSDAYEKIKNNVKANIDLQKRENELMLMKRQFLKEEAELNQEVAKNREAAADKTKTDEERLQALLKAEEAVQKLYDKRIQLRQIENQILKEKDDLFENDIAANEAAAQREAELINLQTERFQALKQLRSQITGFQEQLAKEEAERLEKARLAEIESIKRVNEKAVFEVQKRIDEEVKAIQDAAIRGEIPREEAEKRIADFKKSMVDDVLAKQIEGLEKLLEFEQLTAEEREEVEKKLYELRKQLNDAIFEQIQQNEEKGLESLEGILEKIQELYQQFTSNVGALFKSLSDKRIAALDAEIAKVDENAKRELLLAGNNEAAKQAIQQRAELEREKLEAKRKRERQQQAKIEKAMAVFNAIINTAVQVTKVLANPILAAFVAAMGAAQVAAIVAQPIPQFKKGTSSAPGGLAIVGEEGPELIRKGNRVALSPGVPTLVNLPKGTEVIPTERTMDIITRQEFAKRDNFVSLKEIVMQGNRELVEAMYKTAPNYIKNGTTLYEVITSSSGNRIIKRKSIFG
jgi:hypothetical protein